jgi:hypothetical protein
LSQQQVQSALGFPVKSAVSNPGNCIYEFSNNNGGINFGLSISSADTARRDFNAKETIDENGDDSTLSHLTGIGQDAFLYLAKGQAAYIEVLSGNTIFGLQISWAEAPHKPDIAIALAREALARLRTGD